MSGERTLAFGALAASGVLSLALYAMNGFGPLLTSPISFLAVILAPASFVIYKWGDWMIPYFTQAKRTITSREAEVDIPLTEDVIVKEDGGTVYATTFLGVRIYRSVTTMEEGEKFAFMDLWERAVSGLKIVTKYAVLVYLKDLSRYRDSVETRKAQAQMAIAHESEAKAPDPQKIEKLEREISMWDSMLSRLNVGDKPIGMITFVQVSAKGPTRDGAIAAVRQRVNEIRGVVGTTLNAEVITLTGDDMRRCFDWKYTIPLSSGEAQVS